MQYLPFGKTGRLVSRLGFGMMRLPTTELKDGKRAVDRDEAIRMLRHGIDSGINYVDTAYGYHHGESEIVTGLGLKDGYRGKVMLTTKLPQWLVNKEEDYDRLLDEQLEKLDVSYLDFYLLHSLNADAFAKLQGLNYQKFLDKAKADGRIRFAGFSFHDDKEAFPPILDDYPWDTAQIQFNYLDDENQATVEGLKYAGSKGIPVIVMEPLRGGSLANPPPEVRSMIESHEPRMSPVEWAFRYVADFPGAATILSGMSTFEQLEMNLRIFENLKPGNLSEAGHAFIRSLKQRYLSRIKIGCTTCNYCQPCPHGVQIPRIFQIYNEAYMLSLPSELKWEYARVMKDGADGFRCVRCGQCEAVCPQKLPIMDALETIHREAQ